MIETIVFVHVALAKILQNIKKEIREMFSKSAYEVWKDEKEAGVIITLCRDLDDAIGGGIPIGPITELVGGPSVGKTQFW